MEPDESTPETFYRDLNLRSRVKSDISMLQRLTDLKTKCSVRNDRLRVEVFMNSSKYSFKLMSEEIVFELALGRAYPVSKPRLYLRTGLFQPYINDFRDLLDDVLLPDAWSHKMCLADIVQKLPSFLQRLSNDSHSPLLVQKMGKFYLGDKLSLA